MTAIQNKTLNLILGAVAALVAGAGSVAGWERTAPAAQAETCTGASNRVAIADIGGGLPTDQLIVSTGRQASNDIGVCGDYSLYAARYGVVTQQGSETYGKMHWSQDPGAGARLSCLSFLATCSNAGVTYSLYSVTVQ